MGIDLCRYIYLAKIVKALQMLVKSFAVKSFEHWRIILWRGAPLSLHQEFEIKSRASRICQKTYVVNKMSECNFSGKAKIP